MDTTEHMKTIYGGLVRFNRAQRQELLKKKNLSKDHWSTNSKEELLTLLEDKLNLLWDCNSTRKQKKLCTDIGNFAMMVRDNLGGK